LEDFDHNFIQKKYYYRHQFGSRFNNY